MIKKQNNTTNKSLLYEVISLLLGCMSLLVILSLVSYKINYIVLNKNLIGHFGEFVGGLLLYSFGIIAYLLPCFLLIMAWQIFHHKVAIFYLGGKFCALFLIMISMCTLCTIGNSYIQPKGIPSLGGILGLICLRWSEIAFGVLGTAVISIMLLAIASLLLNISWLKFGTIVYSLISKFITYTKKHVINAANISMFLVKKIISLLQTKTKELPKIKPSIVKKYNSTEKTIIQPKTTHILPKNNQILPTGTKTHPALELLDDGSIHNKNYEPIKKEELEHVSRILEAKLLDFNITARVVAILPGPVITRFELELSPGTKVSKLAVLAKDLARSLSVVSVRIVDLIPGKNVVGVEIPNANRIIVSLRDLIASNEYQQSTSALTLALGKDISGVPIIADLGKMPHLLVAGTTGSGKSVGINAMLLSILYKTTPEQCRLILLDPKMLELCIYDGIPHLLAPVITDMKDAANALRWCVAEMERRYALMANLGVRNLASYNQKIIHAQNKGEPLFDPQAAKLNKQELLTPLPVIVIIIDEFADMMMMVGKKVEELIARIAQKARASGMHMILATQRPSVDVITGLIKANIPSRIAFQVSSKIDSRTILDQQGAEQLLGFGDMLYLAPGTGLPIRIHGAFVSDDEVHRVVKYLKQTSIPNYVIDFEKTAFNVDVDANQNEEEEDPLFNDAKSFICKSKRATVSSLQRYLKIGFNRAARLMEILEARGIVSAMQSNGLREILVREE